MFLISEDEIGELLDVTEDLCNSEGWVTPEQIALAKKRIDIVNRIKARQHTPASEQYHANGDDNDKEICKRCLAPYMREGCSCPESCDVAERKARKATLAENKRVLDDMQNWIVERIGKSESPNGWDFRNQELVERIQSLRTTAAQEQHL